MNTPVRDYSQAQLFKQRQMPAPLDDQYPAHYYQYTTPLFSRQSGPYGLRSPTRSTNRSLACGALDTPDPDLHFERGTGNELVLLNVPYSLAPRALAHFSGYGPISSYDMPSRGPGAMPILTIHFKSSQAVYAAVENPIVLFKPNHIVTALQGPVTVGRELAEVDEAFSGGERRKRERTEQEEEPRDGLRDESSLWWHVAKRVKTLAMELLEIGPSVDEELVRHVKCPEWASLDASVARSAESVNFWASNTKGGEIPGAKQQHDRGTVLEPVTMRGSDRSETQQESGIRQVGALEKARRLVERLVRSALS